MVTGVGDVGTDVPMLVIDQQPTVGGRRVFTLDSELPTSVFCPISEEVVDDEEQEKDSGNEMDLVPERCTTARLALRPPVRRNWRVGRLK